MKIYELTYIITPELNSKEVGAKAKEIESLVQNNEGIILKQASPVAKTLAYPIKKSASGFLGTLEFEIEPEKLNEFRVGLAKDEKITRQMVVIKKSVKAGKKLRTRTKLAKIFETQLLEKGFFSGKDTEDKKVPEDKGKIELKDIGQKLEELLGE